jgi:hypothetical protein
MSEPAPRKPAPPIARATCPLTGCAQKLDRANRLEACWDLMKHMKDTHQMTVPVGFASDHVKPIDGGMPDEH